MDLGYLKKLIRLVEKSNVSEIEVEEEGTKIRISKNTHSATVGTQSHLPSPPIVFPAATPPPEPAPAEVPPSAPKPEIAHHEIKSPIVGTFYRAPAPDADPYVEVGQVVQVGTVLCLIEAMKLMNEIESDAAGRIVRILVENGQPVEYNQPLFLIEPI